VTALLVALLGAAGLALFATSLPIVRRPTLDERIAPHLPGAAMPRSTTPSNLLQHLAARLPGSEHKDRDLLRRLVAAGSTMNPLAFRAEQLAWGALALAGVALITIGGAAIGGSLDPATTPLLAGIAFAGGFFGRDWWLTRQVQNRRNALKEELPTAIDLLALALLAGESPAPALARAAEIMGGSVGAEFDRILGEVRAGEPFIDALQRARNATTDSTLARFFDALINGIERGAPLAEVLRVQADEARHARGREMLEIAGRKEVLMLVPVVFLIMPVVILYALFPGLASLDLFVP
jgi:tight adherence protein C